MSTTHETKNESGMSFSPQESAVYIHGDELKMLQTRFAEQIHPDASPHMPRFAGEVFDRILPVYLEREAEKARANGMPEDAISANIAEEWDDIRSRVMKDVIAIYGYKAPDMFSSDAELRELIKRQRDMFMDRATPREYELESYKNEFITFVEFAIERGGLPITKEQLHQRLDGVKIGFSAEQNLFNLEETGEYSIDRRSVLVHIGFLESDARHTVFHELFHAISGQRIIEDEATLSGITLRRIGLEDGPNRRKTWLNEAITESLADIFTSDGGAFLTDFGDTDRPLPIPNTFTKEEIEAGGYHSEMMAASLVLTQISAHTLLRAYFAQDNDPFEEDQRAGAHAERELWRAIKVASGAERIRDLRLLERGFEDDKTKKRSLKIARKMERQDRKTSSRRRRRNEDAVWRNTEKRIRMLKAAKGKQ